ncbi:MAG: hypothetical protein WCF18_00325, partial [Chthoniobacteraceae bacterium]
MGNNNLDENTNGTSAAPKKPAAFTLLPEPVVFGEVEGDAHKFEATRESAPSSVAPTPVPQFEDLGELPASYQNDVLFLTARDPRWLFSYWDFDWAPYLPSAFRGGIRQFF